MIHSIPSLYAQSDMMTGTRIVVPDDITAFEVMTIPKNGHSNVVETMGVFSGRNDIVEVVLPEGITEITESMFCRCKNLERVVLPDSIIKIDWYAFSGCTKLKDFTFPNKVTKIGVGAFLACKSLEAITIPEGVAFLDNDTFNQRM